MLVDKGHYATSAVCMLEIAKAQLKNASPPDELQAPGHLIPVASRRASDINSTTVVGGRSFSADQSHAIPKPSSRSTGSAGAGTRIVAAGPTKDSLSAHLLGKGYELLEQGHGATDDGLAILNVLRRGVHQLIAHSPKGTGSVLRTVWVSQWRGAAKYVKYAEKASKGMDVLEQAYTFFSNMHSALPVATLIFNSEEPWSTKSGELSTWFAAISLSSVAQTVLGPMHPAVRWLRTGAAMLGADVMHPTSGDRQLLTFDNRSFADPRMYMSWQFLNYVDSRAVTVFDVDTVYLLLHSRIDRR